MSERETLAAHEEESSISWRHPYVLIAGLILILAAGALGYLLRGDQVPGPNSADVGFARDMSEHHRQAVEMSALLYDRTEDEAMRVLAYDILSTQQGQIGIMTGWLDVWGYRKTDFGPRMTWMGMPVEGLMPGMATREELDQLREAEGVEADGIFLRLMIPHHRSGVAMAAAAAEKAEAEFVRSLARGMAEAQDQEIDYMQELLQAKGFEPVPEEAPMEMDH